MRIQFFSFSLHHISSFLILLCLFIDCSEQCAATAPATTPQPSGFRTTIATTAVTSVTTTVASATTTTTADQTTTTVATTTTMDPGCVCAQSLITIKQGTGSHVDPTSVLGSADGCGTDAMGTHSTLTFTCQKPYARYPYLSFYNNGEFVGSGGTGGTETAMRTLNCSNGQWHLSDLVVSEVDCQVL